MSGVFDLLSASLSLNEMKHFEDETKVSSQTVSMVSAFVYADVKVAVCCLTIHCQLHWIQEKITDWVWL